MLERYKVVSGERCIHCGTIHRVAWIAPHDLWKDIVSKDGVTLCVECFDELCAFNGIELVWTCTVR